MAVDKNCVCPKPIGKGTCPDDEKIVATWWIHRSRIIAKTYATIADCCDNGTIATFALEQADPSVLDPSEAFQSINTLVPDDNTGAGYGFARNWDGLKKTGTANTLYKIHGVDPETECIADKLVGNEIVFVNKYASGKYRMVNSEGGQRVTRFELGIDNSYYELEMSTSTNGLDKFIDQAQADDYFELIADGGLVAA